MTVKRVEISLSPSTYRRAQALAAVRQNSVETLLGCLIEQAIETEAPADRTLGLFADESNLIDEAVEEALADRERRWMNAPSE